MSNELVRQDAYANASLDERMRYLSTLARAGDLLPRAFMGRPMPNPNGGGMLPAQVEVGKLMLVAELGSSLGLHPASAVQSIYIIDGKPSLSANLLSALVRKAGHKLRMTTKGSVATDDFVAIAELIRSDDPDFTFHVEWSMERAHRAGLTGKDNWKKYPEAMLKSRAITEVVREGAPDVTIFAAYAPEEVGATVNEEGEPVEMTQVRETPPPAAPKRQAPIVDPQAAEPEPQPEPAPEEPSQNETPAEEAFDWGKAAANAASSAEARELFQKAQREGVLNLKVKQGRKSRELGDLLIEIGKGLVEAEKTAAEAAEEDVVMAEVIEDGESMALGGDQQ